MKYNNYYKSRENSIITDIYYKQMINIFTCNCGNETYSFQKILDIPLLINNNQKEITIEALIDNFLKEILVDLNDRCSKCKKIKKNIKKYIRFNILNEIIIFSIQRIDPMSSTKNISNINYDKILDLTRFTDSPYKDNNNSYKLFATIHHNGTISYGHYYSLICIEDQWYEFNDSHVRVMENMSFNSSNVCVLFYKKIQSK